MEMRLPATYRDGAVHLQQPLSLPDDTAVVVTIVSVAGASPEEGISQQGIQMAAALERLAAIEQRTVLDPSDWQRQQRMDGRLADRGD